MNFNPLMFQATSRNNNNTAQSTTYGTIPRYLSGYVPTQVTYREYEPSVQFKVFAFDKVNSGSLNLGDAANVYRFELLENRSFAGFLNVLKGHGISSQSHKFNYVDDEQDLIVLSTEYDFKYMLKIMKGKTIKIVSEKIPQPASFSCPRAQRPNCAGFRNLPFFMQPIRERQQESEEKLLEHALDSVFSGIFEKKQERPQQIPINTPRVRTIRLSDLLKEASSQKEEEKPEKKEEKKTRTFEDYIAELFGMKLAERTSQEEQSNKQETKEEKVVTEQQQVTTDEKKEETIKEASQQVEKQVEETPVLTTSQIISNYLIGDEEEVITEDEEEEESEDELSSVASEPVNQEEVQYPTLRQEEEEEEEQPTNSIPETLNQEQPTYEKELKLLSDMGFSDQSENLKLLTKYSGDVQRAVSELIYYY